MSYGDVLERMAELVIKMTGMTREEFFDRHDDDEEFHNAFTDLVDMYFEER